MQRSRTTARRIGILFITATVTAVVGGLLIAPTEEADAISAAAASAAQVTSGVLLELVLALSVVGIAALAYPVLRREDEGLALGLLGARVVEGCLLLAATTASAVVLALGRDVGDAGTGTPAIGDLLTTTRATTYVLGALVMLGVSTIIFNLLLYRSRLVPRWLSSWGLGAGLLIALRGVVELYGVALAGPLEAVLAAPIALQEMVLAVRLIVRGFDDHVQSLHVTRRDGHTTIDLQVEQEV